MFHALLHEIPIDDSEEKIREIIISVIHSNKQFDMTSFSESDFEFIDVNGKQACVPTCQETQQFNARAVKQMAGTGAVYVRLVKKIPSRLVKKIPSRAIYVQDDNESSTSKSDRTSHIYISGSVDLPSFLPMQRAFQSSSGASSSRNSAPILQANQSSSGSSLHNSAPILQANQSSSGSSSSHNSAPILQANQSSSGSTSSLTVHLYKLFNPVLVLNFHTHPPMSVHLWYKLLPPHITVHRLIYPAVLVLYPHVLVHL